MDGLFYWFQGKRNDRVIDDFSVNVFKFRDRC